MENNIMERDRVVIDIYVPRRKNVAVGAEMLQSH